MKWHNFARGGEGARKKGRGREEGGEEKGKGEGEGWGRGGEDEIRLDNLRRSFGIKLL